MCWCIPKGFERRRPLTLSLSNEKATCTQTRTQHIILPITDLREGHRNSRYEEDRHESGNIIYIYLLRSINGHRTALIVKKKREEKKLTHPRQCLSSPRQNLNHLVSLLTCYSNVYYSKRYWYNDQWYKEGGSAFLMLGGESGEDPYWVEDGMFLLNECPVLSKTGIDRLSRKTLQCSCRFQVPLHGHRWPLIMALWYSCLNTDTTVSVDQRREFRFKRAQPQERFVFL